MGGTPVQMPGPRFEKRRVPHLEKGSPLVLFVLRSTRNPLTGTGYGFTVYSGPLNPCRMFRISLFPFPPLLLPQTFFQTSLSCFVQRPAHR